MARIVVVAGTDAGYKVADVLAAAGHDVARAQALDEASGAEALFVESWLYATGSATAAAAADVPVIIITSSDALAAAVDAVRSGGAYDLLRVPSTADEMRLAAARALRHRQLVRENAELRRDVESLRGESLRGPGATAPSTAQQAAETAQEEGDEAAAMLDGAAAAGQSEAGAAATPAVGLDGDVAAIARNLAGKPLADIEKQVILSTLEQFKGHRLRTAAALGIGVRTLGMKIKRWREEGEPIAGRQPRPAVHVDVS
jgi:DNA-binding NtrC family response regulator